MLNFVETIRRGNVVTVDGYSTLKYRKNAIKEIGRWIAENIDADEGNSIIEYTTEAMEPNRMDGGYFFEIEEVPCATQYDEETDEMEYAEGNWYFCIRVITGFEEETEQQAETEPAEKYETEATAEQKPEITVTLEWFDQKDFKPNWNARHHKKVHGTPEECMAQIREFKDHHDVVKYTIVNIVDISRREPA